MQHSEINNRMKDVRAAVVAAAQTGGTLPVWTVSVQAAHYNENVVEVEATDAAAACEAALAAAEADAAGWKWIEGAEAEPFVAAMCYGKGDPFDGIAPGARVPVTYRQHGTKGRDCLPAMEKHAPIYEALAAYAKARGLQRVGRTFGEFRDSMVEFVADLRAVLADCGLPLHDVLTASGPDGVSPFIVVTEEGCARLESAHPDLDGLTYAAVDLDTEGCDPKDLHVIDAGGVAPVCAWLSFRDAEHTTINALTLESAPLVCKVQAAE